MLRKATLSNMQDDSEIDHNSSTSIKQIDFLLCPSCFWCASYFNMGKLSIVNCPNCYNNDIQQLPISTLKETELLSCTHLS